MKNKGMMIFGGIFAAVGLGFLFLQTIPSLLEAHEMKSWTPIQARVMSANLDVSKSDDSTTYKVTGSYRYYWNEKSYTGSKISIHSGHDNIGSYHQDTYYALNLARRTNQDVTVYVNPANPNESIYDRHVRWSLMIFGLMFVFCFGGIGIGVITWAIVKGHKKLSPRLKTNEPWLANADWQGGPIYSNAKAGLVIIVFGALIWNGLSFPMAWLIYDDNQLNNGPIFLFALFPVIGIFLALYAIKMLRQWRHYGKTPLHLDPFPGSIGGNFGGFVEINTPYTSDAYYKVTLSCLYSYVSGSGKNRTRKENVVWQETGYGDTNSFNKKTRVKFRFEIPDGLKESEIEGGNAYHLWRFNIESLNSKVKIDRSFEVPVFATRTLSQIPYPLSKNHPAFNEHTLESLESFLKIDRQSGVLRVRMPIGKRLGMAWLGTIIGLIISAIIAAIYLSEKSAVPLYFSPIGILILVPSLFALGKSRLVEFSNSEITSHTYFIGIPVSTKRLKKLQFKSFDKKNYASSNSGHKQERWYALKALGKNKEKITLIDRLHGSHEVDTLIQSIKTLSEY